MKITKTELKNMIKECLREELGKRKLTENVSIQPDDFFLKVMKQAVKNASGIYESEHPEVTEEAFYLDTFEMINEVETAIVFFVPGGFNIEVPETVIEGIEWRQDAIQAVVDYLLEEARKKKLHEKYITEGTDYKGNAIKMLLNSPLYNHDQKICTEIVNSLQKEDIPAFRHAPAWLEKYLKGVVRIMIDYCKGNNKKAEQFLNSCGPVFDKYLTYVKNERSKIQNEKDKIAFDNKFLQEMSYEDVKKENNLR